jgi:hypothetical protein
MSTQYDPNRFDPQQSGRPAPTPAAMNDDTRSVPQLLADMLTELTGLFRKELQLARAEIGESASGAGRAVPGIAGGAALALGGLVLLLMAAAALIARLFDVPVGWGQLIIGIVAAAAGYALIRAGQAKLQASNLMPKRTAEQLARDAEAAKEQIR